MDGLSHNNVLAGRRTLTTNQRNPACGDCGDNCRDLYGGVVTALYPPPLSARLRIQSSELLRLLRESKLLPRAVFFTQILLTCFTTDSVRYVFLPHTPHPTQNFMFRLND